MAELAAVRAERAIVAFRGSWEFLSNFYPSPVTLPDGITYPTVEHAFQAWKTRDTEQRRRIAALATPGEAKQAGRHVTLRRDWESIKKHVMLRALLDKFGYADLARMLCATGDADLTEGNTWHDNYWGDCTCGRPKCAEPGLNYLGRLLMAVRLVVWDDSQPLRCEDIGCTDHPGDDLLAMGGWPP